MINPRPLVEIGLPKHSFNILMIARILFLFLFPIPQSFGTITLTSVSAMTTARSSFPGSYPNFHVSDVQVSDSDPVLADVRTERNEIGADSIWASARASANYFQSVPDGEILSFEISLGVQAFNTFGVYEPNEIEHQVALMAVANSSVMFRFFLSEASWVTVSGGGGPVGVGQHDVTFSGSSVVFLRYLPELDGEFKEVSFLAPAGEYNLSSFLGVSISPAEGDGFREFSPSYSVSIRPLPVPEPSAMGCLAILGGISVGKRKRQPPQRL